MAVIAVEMADILGTVVIRVAFRTQSRLRDRKSSTGRYAASQDTVGTFAIECIRAGTEVTGNISILRIARMIVAGHLVNTERMAFCTTLNASLIYRAAFGLALS